MSGRRSTRTYDETDARVRPGRGSRPRSKVRPAHDDAVPGVVIAVEDIGTTAKTMPDFAGLWTRLLSSSDPT